MGIMGNQLWQLTSNSLPYGKWGQETTEILFQKLFYDVASAQIFAERDAKSSIDWKFDTKTETFFSDDLRCYTIKPIEITVLDEDDGYIG